jgi:hypothetical protein
MPATSTDANYTDLAYVAETTFGNAPASPTLKALRLRSEDIQHAKDTVVSEELRSDRQVSDMAEVGSSATGGFQFELSYEEYQPFLEALLCGTITEFDYSSVSSDISASAQTLTATTPGDYDDFPVGGYVRISGASNPLNNGIKRVLTNDGDVMTFAAGSFVANQTGASLSLYTKDLRNGIIRRSFTLERRLVNGLNVDCFQRYTGMNVGGMTLSVASKEIINGAFTFLGKYGRTFDNSLSIGGTEATGVLTLAGNPSDGNTVTIDGVTYTFRTSPDEANEIDIGAAATNSIDNLIAAINGAAGEGTLYGTGTEAHPTVLAAAGSGDTMDVTARTAGTVGNSIATTKVGADLAWGAATLTGGTGTLYTASTTNPIMNGTSNIGRLDAASAAFEEKLKMVDIEINNNLRGKDALGEAGNFEIGLGTFNASGKVSAYFQDNTLYARLINHDDTAIGFYITDADGDSIGIVFPRVKFGTGNPNATGINTDVMLDIDFQAILDPVSGATAIISFLPGL